MSDPHRRGGVGVVTGDWGAPSPVTADGIAAALGQPVPTEQQRGVIEAGPAPALVIAGAGSGKTETMAGRVVWLVANGHVRRDEVLGLTFTRKAAGELSERVDRRLGMLAEFGRRGLLPHVDRLARDGELERFWAAARSAPQRRRRAMLTTFLDGVAGREGTAAEDADDALLLRPRVSTYNAFADALVREHGAHIGRDDEQSLLSASASWLLARRVVVASDDPRLAERGEAFSTVVDAVHRLAGELLDNRVRPEDVDRVADDWAGFLAAHGNPLKQTEGPVEKFLAAMTGLPVLTGLVRDYATRKQAQAAMDFADQVAGALEIVEQAPGVAAALRDQYRVVLLDEFQDTSVLQTRLLAAVFAGSPVMAVGDPNQSIYGWRGASADNLSAFTAAFGRGEVQRFDLSVSWRNDRRILTAANRLVEEAPTRGVPVGALEVRPGAGDGRVDVAFAPSLDDEADAVARWFVDVRADAARRDAMRDPGSASEPHSGAILFRAKRHMTLFADALGRAGVPHRILGLGGLLATPEVVDVVSALRVVHDPSAGSALLRLLAGPRFAVGVADLAALRDLADLLHTRDAAGTPLAPEVLAGVPLAPLYSAFSPP